MWRVAMVAGVFAAAACGSNESAVCKHLAKLCGDDVIDPSCASDLKDLKDVLGDSYGKAMTCATEASSCPEVAGCFAGGFGNALDRWQGQFEHGANKVMNDRDDHRDHGDDDHVRSVTTHDDSSSAFCTKFSSSDHDARWDGCGDHVKRELRCEESTDQLKCDCLEDGVSSTWFFAKDPPLGTRDDATRVAKKNCRPSGFDKL